MSYPSDLNDQEWDAIRHHFEYENGYGNRRKHSPRIMLNAILYLVKSGCQWRMLPKEFPPWKSVYTYYRRLCLRGTWEAALDELNQVSRQRSGRSALPTQAIVDSQSVKTIYRGAERGYDGGKKSERKKTSYRR